jgi:DNA gyrase subunit B
MTDADVDGSHIRTLILTFLYRHMPELVERGHVFIAVPPLYLVKLGGQQTYLQKDSQLDDLLVRERFPDLEIEGRDGAKVKLTEARYGRFQRTLKEYEGWSARLRSDFGSEAAFFVVAHRLVESEAGSLPELSQEIAEASANGYEIAVSSGDQNATVFKIVEVETSTASHVRVPAELLESPIYARVRSAYARLGEILDSRPPFKLRLGKKSAQAETFESLRDQAFSLAKEGLQISRFKGLGEMNFDQLRDTTMDPAQRLLIRVDVEDASAADHVFSMLMGDQVEPRREFIEQNAREVRFLDV